jgi:5-methylcytosine-specific restriction endonuclease McrA
LARKKKRSRSRPTFIDPYYFTREWRNLRQGVLRRDRYRCRYCGEKASQADHVVPRKKGGWDTPDNLVACCPRCNRLVGNAVFGSVERKRAWVRGFLGLPETKDPQERPRGVRLTHRRGA